MSVNLDRAIVAWGVDMPSWVKLLANACDRTNQKAVAERIGKSGGYISRILNRNYAGSYTEAETIVRAVFSDDEVACPLWGLIPLATCIRARRRREPPRNGMHHAHARTCPTCINNTDRPASEEE